MTVHGVYLSKYKSLFHCLNIMVHSFWNIVGRHCWYSLVFVVQEMKYTGSCDTMIIRHSRRAKGKQLRIWLIVSCQNCCFIWRNCEVPFHVIFCYSHWLCYAPCKEMLCAILSGIFVYMASHVAEPNPWSGSNIFSIICTYDTSVI
jgi:hypothetical protein